MEPSEGWSRSGFTILELLIVIAVIGVLVAVAPFALRNDQFVVNQAVERFEGELRRARMDAVRINHPVFLEVGQGGYRVVREGSGSLVSQVDVSSETGLSLQVNGPADEEFRLRIDPRGVSYFLGTSTILSSETFSVTFTHPRGSFTVVEVNGYGRTRHVQ